MCQETSLDSFGFTTLKMLEAISPSVWLFSPISSTNGTSIAGIHFRGKFWNPATSHPQCTGTNSAHLSSPFAPNCLLQGQEGDKFQTHFFPKAAASHSSAGTAEYTEEPATRLKFQTSVSLPGCSTLLTLLGTGYREKVLAIIGVKIYAAALYVNQSILTTFDAWKGKSAGEIQADTSLFNSIFQAPSEKSLQIVLVRDVDGKTFWDALDDAISPRINTISPTDESALSTFRAIFQRQPLKKGTIIHLTWLDTSTILVSVSSDGLPSEVDAKIESVNVSSALFDVFLGDVPVSPTLKSSVSSTLAAILK